MRAPPAASSWRSCVRRVFRVDRDRDSTRPVPHLRPREAGFTIFEVMMSTAILSLAIATSITTIQRGYTTLDTARNLTLAGQIMVTEMEKIRMLDWTTVSAYPAGPTTLTIDSNFTNNPKIGTRFSLTRSVSTVGGNSELLQISLTITWRSYDGHSLSRTYTTYYAHYGIHDYLYNTS